MAAFLLLTGRGEVLVLQKRNPVGEAVRGKNGAAAYVREGNGAFGLNFVGELP